MKHELCLFFKIERFDVYKHILIFINTFFNDGMYCVITIFVLRSLMYECMVYVFPASAPSMHLSILILMKFDENL